MPNISRVLTNANWFHFHEQFIETHNFLTSTNLWMHHTKLASNHLDSPERPICSTELNFKICTRVSSNHGILQPRQPNRFVVPKHFDINECHLIIIYDDRESRITAIEPVYRTLWINHCSWHPFLACSLSRLLFVCVINHFRFSYLFFILTEWNWWKKLQASRRWKGNETNRYGNFGDVSFNLIDFSRML